MPELPFERHISNAQRINGDVKIFALLYAVAYRAHVWQHFFDRFGLLRRTVKIAIGYRLIDHELYMGLCVSAQSLIFAHALLSNEFIRISLIREDQNFHLEILRQKNLDSSLRCLHTRSIPIIIDQY